MVKGEFSDTRVQEVRLKDSVKMKLDSSTS